MLLGFILPTMNVSDEILIRFDETGKKKYINFTQRLFQIA